MRITVRFGDEKRILSRITAEELSDFLQGKLRGSACVLLRIIRIIMICWNIPRRKL